MSRISDEKQTRTEQVLEGMIRHYEQVMHDCLPAGRLDKYDIDYIEQSGKSLEAMARTLLVYREQGFKDIEIEEEAENKEDAEDKDKIIQDLKNKLRRYENEREARYAELVKENSLNVASKKYEGVFYEITYMAWYDRTIVYVVDERQGDGEPAKIELLDYSWGDARNEDFCKVENLDKMFDRYDKNDTRTNVVIARAEYIRDYADGLMADYDDATYAYDAGLKIKSYVEGILEALSKEDK